MELADENGLMEIVDC